MLLNFFNKGIRCNWNKEDKVSEVIRKLNMSKIQKSTLGVVQDRGPTQQMAVKISPYKDCLLQSKLYTTHKNNAVLDKDYFGSQKVHQ